MAINVKKKRGLVSIMYTQKGLGIFLILISIFLASLIIIPGIDFSYENDLEVFLTIPIFLVIGIYHLFNKKTLTIDLNKNKIYHNNEELIDISAVDYFQILKKDVSLLNSFFNKSNSNYPYQIVMVNKTDEYEEIFPPMNLKNSKKVLEILSREGFETKKETISKKELENDNDEYIP